MPSNPFDPGYYDETELAEFGFGSLGTNVRIATNCTIINLRKIHIGSNVRIDGNATIVGGPGEIMIGSFIHIGGGGYIIGGAGVVLEDFCNLSQSVRIYTRSDDFTRGAMTNPMVPKEYTNVTAKPVTLRKHTVIGSGSVILPGVVLAEGTSVGALALVRKSTEPWGVYAGNPARRIMDRTEIDRKAEAALIATLSR
jgi:acetyltransferase-like isoleucine patch superfamily enzyme